MAISITSIDLAVVDENGNAIGFEESYASLVKTPVISIADKVKMTVVIEDSTNFANGDEFVFNPHLFDSDPAPALPSNPTLYGYKIKVIDKSADIFSINLTASSSPETNKNFFFDGITFSGTNDTITFNFSFYCTYDLKRFIENIVLDNRTRFLKDTNQNSSLLYNRPNDTIYSTLADSYLVFYIFYTESGAATGQYIQETTQGTDQVYFPLRGQFYDQIVGGGNDWTGFVGTVQRQGNWLQEITIDGGGFSGITDVTSKPRAFTSNFVDQNFVVNANALCLNATNDVTVKIGNMVSPAVITSVQARLIRIDETSFTTTFVNNYSMDTALIPSSDGSTSWLNSGASAFGTPASWTSADPAVIQFKIDGNKLVSKAEYRIIITLYYKDGVDGNTADFESVHISPALVTSQNPAIYPNIESELSTYNSSVSSTAADVSTKMTIRPHERFKAAISLDNSSYEANYLAAGFTARSLSDDLASVRCFLSSPSNFRAEPLSLFDIGTQTASGLLTIVSSDIENYEIEARADSNFLSDSLSYVLNWRLIFNQEFNGLRQQLVLDYKQEIDIEGWENDEVSPALAIEFLDFDDYQVGVETVIQQICGIDKCVVKVTATGLGSSRLVAMTSPMTVDFSRLGSIGQVQEEESFLSSYLDRLSSQYLDAVDSNFSAGVAYYVLNSNLFTGNWRAQALVYEITPAAWAEEVEAQYLLLNEHVDAGGNDIAGRALTVAQKQYIFDTALNILWPRFGAATATIVQRTALQMAKSFYYFKRIQGSSLEQSRESDGSGFTYSGKTLLFITGVNLDYDTEFPPINNLVNPNTLVVSTEITNYWSEVRYWNTDGFTPIGVFAFFQKGLADNVLPNLVLPNPDTSSLIPISRRGDFKGVVANLFPNLPVITFEVIIAAFNPTGNSEPKSKITNIVDETVERCLNGLNVRENIISENSLKNIIDIFHSIRFTLVSGSNYDFRDNIIGGVNQSTLVANDPVYGDPVTGKLAEIANDGNVTVQI